MKGQLRKSGIDIIGDIPWGTHFCQFYQTKEDLIDILVIYFKAGLENNELCIWVTSQALEVEEAKEALGKAVPDIDVYLERGQIEIIPYTQSYLKDNPFDSEKILDGWIEKLNQALTAGYDGMRSSGDTFWLEKKDWSNFVEYEEEIDSLIGNYQMLALCTYSLERCNAIEIIDVTTCHQFSLIKRKGKWERIESSRHKKAEEEAVEATKNWEYTFDAVPDLISIIDTEYRVVRANRAMTARLGMTPEECVGLTCYRVIHGTDEPPSFCPHRQLLKDGLEHTEEVCEDSLGGDFIVSVSPLHDLEGKLTGCIHLAHDITKRKRAEEALRQSEERLRFALETSHTGAWDLDLVDHTAYRSLEHDRIFGYEQLLPEWTYEMFLDHVLPGDREMVDAKFRKATTALSDWSFECRIRRVDGEVRWIWAAGRHSIDATGNMRRMAGIVQDINERKRLEEQTRRRAEEMSKVMEVAPVAIFIGHDPQSHNITSNRMANELYEAEAGENVSANATYVRRLFCKGREITADELPMQKAALKDIEVRDVELDMLLPSGKRRVILGSASPLHDTDGHVRGSIGAFMDITERKRMEEELHQSEERLQVIIANSPDIIFEQDRDLRYIWVFNPTSPLSASDVLGKTDSELLPPDQAQLLTSIKRRVLDTGMREQAILLLTHGGESRWFEAVYEPRYDATGQVIGILSYTRDITERKQAEEALRESEEKYRRLFEAMQEAFFIADIITNNAGEPVDYRIIEANQALETQTGVPLEKFIGNTALEIYPGLDTFWVQTYDRVALTGLPVHFNHYADVQNRHYEGSAYQVRPGRFAAIFLNVTEREQAEEALRESEEKYRNLIETATEGIWILDAEARTTYVNEKMAEMLGYSQEEMIDRFAWDFADEEGKTILKMNMEKRRQGINETYEFKLMCMDGSPLWVLISAKSFFNKDSKFTGSLGMFTDITKRKEAENALKKAHDNLENLVIERTAELEKAYKSLKESEKGLAEAQKMAHIGNWDWNIVTNEIYCSDELYRIFELNPQEISANYDAFFSYYVHPDDRDYVDNAVKRALKGEPYSIDNRIIIANGEERTVHAQTEVIFDEINNMFE